MEGVDDDNNRLPASWVGNPKEEEKNEDGSVKDEYFDRILYPGYRFIPKDQDLVEFYLIRKIKGQSLPIHKIPVVDLYQFSPEILTGRYPLHREDTWFFFSRRNKKYPKGSRPDRVAGDGFWKPTGKPKAIKIGEKEEVFRTSLVYKLGSHKRPKNTDWKMHEFFIKEDPTKGNDCTKLNNWVLCKVYKTKNKGERNCTVEHDHHDMGSQVSSEGQQHQKNDLKLLRGPNSRAAWEMNNPRNSTFIYREPEPVGLYNNNPLSSANNPFSYHSSFGLGEVLDQFHLNQPPIRTLETSFNGLDQNGTEMVTSSEIG